ATIKRGDILLVDLWAREKNGVYADQTWMGSLGPPSDRDKSIWQAVRDARDAAISLLQKKISGHQPVKGGEVDDAARQVIPSRRDPPDRAATTQTCSPRAAARRAPASSAALDQSPRFPSLLATVRAKFLMRDPVRAACWSSSPVDAIRRS